MKSFYEELKTYGSENSQEEGTFEALQRTIVAAAEVYLAKGPIKDAASHI